MRGIAPSTGIRRSRKYSSILVPVLKVVMCIGPASGLVLPSDNF
jgi:hypothetical protein